MDKNVPFTLSEVRNKVVKGEEYTHPLLLFQQYFKENFILIKKEMKEIRLLRFDKITGNNEKTSI